jgi:2-polyprenyl-3-methyl-5-hydroxy-6-metoxy-1,4-benzoquinol methylase
MKNTLSWFNYWNQADERMLANMRRNKEIFLRNSKKIISFNKNDIVLDIGCGPGLLEEHLKDKVKEIHCLDTSEYFINTLKKKFKGNSNIFIHQLSKAAFTDLSFLKHKKFSIVLCMSVVSYYKNIEDFKNLIIEVQKLCKGGILLITDIKVKKGAFEDILGLLKMGFKENCLLESIEFLIRSRFSLYYSVRKNRDLLVIPEEEIRKIIKELKLSAEILDTPLSLNSNRKHLLIKF